VRDTVRLCGDWLTVFGGLLGFESFVDGAQDRVAVASNVAPASMARLFELVADERRIMEARALSSLAADCSGGDWTEFRMRRAAATAAAIAAGPGRDDGRTGMAVRPAFHAGCE
jgi:hypothetical protein